MEAIIGAIYLDSGYNWRQECLRFMKRFDLDVAAAGRYDEGHYARKHRDTLRELRENEALLWERGLLV